MAKKVHGTHGCYVVPAFTGLGAPHWDQYARGTIVGIDERNEQEPHYPRDARIDWHCQVCDVHRCDAMQIPALI